MLVVAERDVQFGHWLERYDALQEADQRLRLLDFDISSTLEDTSREVLFSYDSGPTLRHTRPDTAVWMVMREVLLLVSIGVVAGLAAAAGLTRYVETQLYGLTGHDPLTLILATLGLAAIACAAGYVPAIRASRVDAMQALRYE